MPKPRSVLRYPGGKHYLTERIIARFPAHRIYLEPFAGSAHVLLNKSPSPVEIYNDLDGRLVNLFRVLRDQGDQFRAKVELVPYAEAEFRDAARYPPDADDVTRAVAD